MAQGIIKRYDFRKGFGFITDDNSGEDFFFHKSEWQGDGPIRQGLAVSFADKESDKGPQAETVVPLDGGSAKPAGDKSSKPAAKASTKPAAKPTPKPAPKPVVKPASVEDRLASLESTVGTLKAVSFIALAGVIVLAVVQFAL